MPLRHLYEHKQLAYSVGYNENTCLMLDNGQIAEFNNGKLESTNEFIEVGDVFINGHLIGEVTEDVIHDRESLALDGVVVVNIIYDLRKRKIESDPVIVYKGVVLNDSMEVLNQNITSVCNKHVNDALTRKGLNLDDLRKTLTNEIGKVVHRILKKHINIVINLLENK